MPLRPVIQRRLDRLETKTRSLLQLLENIPPELLTKQPAPDSWSALQALNHVYLGEKLSQQYLHYKFTKPETIPPLLPDAWVRILALKWILRSRMKYKSPIPINMWGDQQILGIPELRSAWKELRADLKAILEDKEEEFMYRLPYKQPFAGRMSLNQMLIFFDCHLDHHTRQIREILARVSS
jgi:uncharacterized damage-inducible protein DinB